jgi:hypothetical protein
MSRDLNYTGRHSTDRTKPQASGAQKAIEPAKKPAQAGIRELARWMEAFDKKAPDQSGHIVAIKKILGIEAGKGTPDLMHLDGSLLTADDRRRVREHLKKTLGCNVLFSYKDIEALSSRMRYHIARDCDDPWWPYSVAEPFGEPGHKAPAVKANKDE